MTHSRVDGNQARITAALRAAGACVITMGRTAGFDILVLYAGGTYIVEIKQPGEEKSLTAGEIRTMNAASHQGVAYWIITCEADALGMIGR
jgi:hypothetical protein